VTPSAPRRVVGDDALLRMPRRYGIAGQPDTGGPDGAIAAPAKHRSHQFRRFTISMRQLKAACTTKRRGRYTSSPRMKVRLARFNLDIHSCCSAAWQQVRGGKSAEELYQWLLSCWVPQRLP
jgi:hypothetical protein